MLELKDNIVFSNCVFRRLVVQLYIIWKSAPLATPMRNQVNRDSSHGVSVATLADGRLVWGGRRPGGYRPVDWVHKHLERMVLGLKLNNSGGGKLPPSPCLKHETQFNSRFTQLRFKGTESDRLRVLRINTKNLFLDDKWARRSKFATNNDRWEVLYSKRSLFAVALGLECGAKWTNV